MPSSRTTRSSRLPPILTQPQALKALLGASAPRPWNGPIPRSRSTRPSNHPVIEAFQGAGGRLIDQDTVDGTVLMSHIPDVGRFLKCHPSRSSTAGPSQRAAPLPLELGITSDDHRWLIHIEGKNSRVEPDKLSRRHLTLSPSTLVRLLMGHTGIDAAASRGRFLGLDRNRDRRRPHPLPGPADLAEPARRGDGLSSGIVLQALASTQSHRPGHQCHPPVLST